MKNLKVRECAAWRPVAIVLFTQRRDTKAGN